MMKQCLIYFVSVPFYRDLMDGWMDKWMDGWMNYAIFLQRLNTVGFDFKNWMEFP
jgi:hypothetical protein